MTDSTRKEMILFGRKGWVKSTYEYTDRWVLVEEESSDYAEELEVKLRKGDGDGG